MDASWYLTWWSPVLTRYDWPRVYLRHTSTERLNKFRPWVRSRIWRAGGWYL